VDRKILALEEESFVRLDLSAHEAVFWPRTMGRFAFLGTVKQFAFTALAIFVLLFSITNAPAYAKMIMASLQGPIAQKMEEAATPELAVLPISGADDQLLALSLTPTSYDNRLQVPSLQINAPIVEPQLGLDALEAKDWNALEDQIRGSLLTGIAHYPGTAEPGKMGNAFYTGHSSNVLWEFSPYNTVFALLPKIEVGADIFITHEQEEFHYRVVSKKEVSPTDTSILKQGDQKNLTLMTCTPVGTALKRLVVTAELID
jgi:sortase A